MNMRQLYRARKALVPVPTLSHRERAELQTRNAKLEADLFLKGMEIQRLTQSLHRYQQRLTEAQQMNDRLAHAYAERWREAHKEAV